MIKRKLFLLIAIAVVAAVLVALALFNPEQSRWFPRCPFLMLTGYKCAGCGSQRAVHALLTGHFARAFFYNALLVISIPYILLYYVLYVWERFRKCRLRIMDVLYGKTAVWVIVTVIVLFTVLRNIFVW